MSKKKVVLAEITPRLLNVRQAAAYLACSIHALRQLQWSGEIPHLKIGKLIQFDRAELDRFVDLQKIIGAQNVRQSDGGGR